ncbi:ATP-binding protein [Sphingomonas sp. Leaf17]|uniref:AAA family ATPase n=1 Tax=Sphingomonas sp. Leaf17 TaxID=1735683 RepID=UPI0006FF8AF6|nr:AAA family ATPase [Sphingomonas sp. Leaf17]KQM65844.1 ATP-binding protein [Sphingomonas sp. Leaf17]
MAKYRTTTLPPPYLKRVWLDPDQITDPAAYPWCLPLFRSGAFELTFEKPVTIMVGENGVGKSTLIEGIAALAGFDEAGGGPGYRAVDHSRALEVGGATLAQGLKAAWLPKISQGWFFRAESFFSVARYLDESGSPSADFLSHSHGEGFMRFFEERCDRPGIYFFDEPESALSPNRQFDFLKLLRRMQDGGQAQVILATHSPILMALPDATLLRMGKYGLEPVELEDTDHFRIIREFALDPHHVVAAMLEE